MTTNRKFILYVLVSLAFLWPVSVVANERGGKKLIYHGWGSPDSLYVRDHWKQMEEMPFDGVGIVIPVDRQAWRQGKRNTHNQLAWQMMGRRAFKAQDFHDSIADLKAARWSKFTDNFFPVMLSAAQSATELNWFDDGRWRTVANNFEALARMAAETGINGLILDPEHYDYALFDYNAQRKRLEQNFEGYKEIARRRGREIAQAVTHSLPRVVLLSLFSYSYPLAQSLSKTPYNLLPAFSDGLLEALPPGATLVDGYEAAYPYKEPGQFAEAHRRIKEAVKISDVPEHYRAKLKASFGLWLDYLNNPQYFTPENFQQAVRVALERSDGYVWIYSQGPRFFPPSGIAPSYIEAIARARN